MIRPLLLLTKAPLYSGETLLEYQVSDSTAHALLQAVLRMSHTEISRLQICIIGMTGI